MRVALLRPDSPVWRATLNEIRRDIYHCPGYTTVAARGEGGEPVAVVASDGGRTLLLPLVLRPILGADRDATSAYGYPGPAYGATASAGFVDDALEAVFGRLRSEGVVSAFVRMHPLLNEAHRPGVGCTVDHGYTVSIDLLRSEAQLRAQLQKGHRTEINRSIRLGHRAVLDDGFHHLDRFVALYEATMRRVGAGRHYFFSDQYYRSLRAVLQDQVHLWTVQIGDAIAAAALFFECDGIVQYHLSGSDETFARERPTKLLLFEVARWAKARGAVRLHLGGGVGGADDGLFRFKAGFSPHRHLFRTLRVVLDERRYRAVCAARHPEADPADISGFFPLYRRP